jgi:hypothetical protein
VAAWHWQWQPGSLAVARTVATAGLPLSIINSNKKQLISGFADQLLQNNKFQGSQNEFLMIYY